MDTILILKVVEHLSDSHRLLLNRTVKPKEKW